MKKTVFLFGILTLGRVQTVKKIIILVLFALPFSQMCLAGNGVKIKRLKGDVQIRRGLEENWSSANTDMLLENIDTILTGEDSEVVLELEEGSIFTLGSRSILDIGDLRRITEKELFLYLMSQKVSRIQFPDKKSKLHIENVSVVRAERKTIPSEKEDTKGDTRMWTLETNGALALHDHKYYTNAIVKFHKILDKYSTFEDCGRIHFNLGNSFEAIHETGRAIDAYQQVLVKSNEKTCDNQMVQEMINASLEAIRRLKK